MKCVKGVWLPDTEEHLLTWAKEVGWRYQGNKIDAVLARVRQWRTAVDVGAHCGLWARELAEKFAKVIAFEPVPEHGDCLRKNAPSVTLHRTALGESPNRIRLRINQLNTGASSVAIESEITLDVPVLPLDSFALTEVDLIKIDVEGYEYDVVLGAVDTIRRWRPAIIVEQKPKGLLRMGYKPGVIPAVAHLKKLDYAVREVIHEDYIMTPEEA